MPRTIYNALLLAVSLFATTANGALIAYSVNSDSNNAQNEDGLYAIDLETGSHERRGDLVSGINKRLDTEGLAFDMAGTLWGIDDDSRTLFSVNTANGSINALSEKSVAAAFPGGGGNDFGMTFACDGALYVSSVATDTLYRVQLDGTAQAVGAEGALGVNISALAAYGNPVQMYGLGNGQLLNGSTDAPNLYRIDMNTGIAHLVGALDQSDFFKYQQAGLAFDATGMLWAIIDRRIVDGNMVNLPSQVLQVNLNTGLGTLVSMTGEVGFESLAIAPPVACGADSDYVPLPVMGPAGRWIAIGCLLFAGLAVLRRRLS